jgi:4'-phosphopantetheinyl transferase
MHALRASRSADGRVRVWLIPLAMPAAHESWSRGLLDDDELERARAMADPSVRSRFVAAHAASRLILADHLGLAPAQIRWRLGKHGKPHLVGEAAGTHANLSHSGALAALAIADRPVGIDLQRMVLGTDATAMARRYYPAGEARYVEAAGSARRRLGRFVRLWTRKEACVKAAGVRLQQGLKLPVHAPAGSVAAGSVAAGSVLVHDPDGSLPGPYLVRDLPVPPGYRAAVAAEGEAWYRVSRRQWEPIS